ncbi:MAG: outer membrane beta-barrel protein [Nitrospirae bacterium]|nr:outer membrane beta-barrel protein [Nitrospirota bacterium]
MVYVKKKMFSGKRWSGPAFPLRRACQEIFLVLALFLPICNAWAASGPGNQNEIPAVQAVTPSDLQPEKAAAAPAQKLEMGRFSSMETAKAFLLNLTESGYIGGIEQQKDSSGQIEYQVHVLLSSVPEAGAGSESLTWSLLGTKGKNIHGAVTLTGIFTDNAFNTKENRKSDFSLFLTPEVWLNLPRTDKGISYESVSPRSAGGHLVDTLLGERLFGYQASLYYRADLPLITAKTSPYGNAATHKLAAGLALIGNRFSLILSDQFEKSYQEREAGQLIRADAENRYDANRLSASAAYDTRNRLIFSLDYTNFTTQYSGESSALLDRHDYGLTPAVRYRITPRINLLAEYTFYSISYDGNSLLDSREQYLLGGLEWRLTEKSFGRLKAGYEMKDFEHGSRYKGYSFELQLEHRLTPKTQVALAAYRKTNETRVIGTAFAISTGARLALSHMITARITAAAKLFYLNDRHRGTSPALLSETAVKDNIYQAGIEVQYAFRRWLRARAEYLFTVKDSTDPAFDYRSNTLLLGLTGSF